MMSLLLLAIQVLSGCIAPAVQGGGRSRRCSPSFTRPDILDAGWIRPALNAIAKCLQSAAGASDIPTCAPREQPSNNSGNNSSIHVIPHVWLVPAPSYARHINGATQPNERTDTYQEGQNDEGIVGGKGCVESPRFACESVKLNNCVHNAQYRSAAKIISNTFSMLSWLDAYLTEWRLYEVEELGRYESYTYA